MRPRPLVLALACIVAILAADVTGAQLAPPFTYQGELALGGQLVDGTCDFEFTLYDSEAGGAMIAGPYEASVVAVAEGRFAAQITGWSTTVWQGDRWLEIAVACPSGGSVTPLTPRRPVTSAPTAALAWTVGTDAVGTLALASGAVTTAKIAAAAVGTAEIDSTEVQRRVGSSCATGTSISAIAADGTVTCEPDDGATYSALSGSGVALTGTEFRGEGSPYDNVIVVAKSGGDFTSIQDALDSIVDASAGNPYLVYVAPGFYEEQVTLKPYVTLEGAGEGATIIRGTGGSEWSAGTVIGANNAAVRHLTVESDGTGQTYAVAFYNYDSSPAMSNVTATASGGTTNYGVYNYSSSSPTMDNVTATASGGTTYNYGVRNSSSSPTMNNVTATASGGTSNYGVYNSSSSPTIRDSVLTGDTNSVYRSGGTVKVANSQLVGPLSSGLTCFGNYDASLVAIVCP